MFDLGDVVTPKEMCIAHGYYFRIKEIELHPSDENLYRIERIEQKLDPRRGSFTEQTKIINKAEEAIWNENGLRLIEPKSFKITGKYYQDTSTFDEKYFDNLTELAKVASKVKINLKGENIIMDILEIYEERKVKVLEKEILEAKIKVKEKDEIQSIILEMTSQVNTILKNQGRKTIYEFEPNLVTLETEAKLDELEKIHHEQIEELRSTLKEIRALFELTDDYNERIKILKNYDILDKKGKLNV